MQCYCFLAFIVGGMPPANFMNLVAAGRTLMNMLNAHTATYRALKVCLGYYVGPELRVCRPEVAKGAGKGSCWLRSSCCCA